MPSEKVVNVLGHLGVDVPTNSFGHYGVKGMKWDKNKTHEELSAEADSASGGANEDEEGPDNRTPEQRQADFISRSTKPNASPIDKKQAKELFILMEKNKGLSGDAQLKAVQALKIRQEARKRQAAKKTSAKVV